MNITKKIFAIVGVILLLISIWISNPFAFTGQLEEYVISIAACMVFISLIGVLKSPVIQLYGMGLIIFVVLKLFVPYTHDLLINVLETIFILFYFNVITEGYTRSK